MNRFRALALALVTVAVLALSGCSILLPQGDGVDQEAELESILLDEIDIANGVIVYKSADGFSPRVSARLYVDSDDMNEIADAVDTAFEAAWDYWPSQPSSVIVGVVIGPKPADAGRSDDNVIDLTAVAEQIGLPSEDARFDIQLSRSQLVERYGE